jgi:hypothetical protein
MSGRPQVGIERLPVRRMSNEPRESMNCKSCRKRKVCDGPKKFFRAFNNFSKIKCNRLRPTCEACLVFQCPCIYGTKVCIAIADGTDQFIDAIPKKRGPKTDVLEALLKRVDGLEQRLKDEKKAHSPTELSPVASTKEEAVTNGAAKGKRTHSQSTSAENDSAVYSPIR